MISGWVVKRILWHYKIYTYMYAGCEKKGMFFVRRHGRKGGGWE